MRAGRLLSFGASAAGAHTGLVFAACVLFGGVSGAGSALVWALEPELLRAAGGDSFLSLVYMTLCDLVIQLTVTILVGPIFQACAAFAAFRHSRGKPGTMSRGMNFAVSRYARMFKPHAAAWVVVLFGLQFIIPGIIYWNRFAVVDAEAALGTSKRPLRRSQTLTRGYRRSIFVMALPWFLYSFVALVAVPTLAGIHPSLLIVHQICVSLYLFILFTGYARLYLERTGRHEGTTDSPTEGQETDGD